MSHSAKKGILRTAALVVLLLFSHLASAQMLFVIEKEGFTKPHQRQIFGPGDVLAFRLKNDPYRYEQVIAEVRERTIIFANDVVIPIQEIASVRVRLTGTRAYWANMAGTMLPLAGASNLILFAFSAITPAAAILSGSLIGVGLLARSQLVKNYRPKGKWQFNVREADGFRYRQFLKAAEYER